MAHVEFRGLIRLATLAGLTLALPALAGAQTAKPAPTFTKDVAPIFQDEVRVVPSARFDRADVARDLRGGAAVGALDQGPRRRRGRCRPGTSTRPSASRTSRTIAR